MFATVRFCMSESLEAQKLRWEIRKIVVAIVVAVVGLPLTFFGYKKVFNDVQELEREYDKKEAGLAKKFDDYKTELEAKRGEAQREHDQLISKLRSEAERMQSRVDSMNQRFNSGRDLFNQSTLQKWELLLNFSAQEAQEIRNESNQRIREVGRRLNNQMRDELITQIEFRRIYFRVRFSDHWNDRRVVSFQSMSDALEEFPDSQFISIEEFDKEMKATLESLEEGTAIPRTEWFLTGDGSDSDGIRVGEFFHDQRVTDLGPSGVELELFTPHGFAGDDMDLDDFPEFKNPVRIHVPFGEVFAERSQVEKFFEFIKNHGNPITQNR